MIFALETSCDETAVALFDPAHGLRQEFVHSQIAMHERYGGVVPDLATREHLRHLPPLLRELRNAEEWAAMGAVAVTHGPGLAGCLAIGLAAAKGVALARRVPLLGVNHLRGHAWSPFIRVHAAAPDAFAARLAQLLPHLGLIVSGGNTLLFTIGRDRRLAVISRTRDDAAGEALDKGAKLLGLGYPGGPLVEARAVGGRIDAFDFPRGIQPNGDLSFSFSGLKTSLRYLVEKLEPAVVTARLGDLCASYQQAVVDALTRKTASALERSGYASVGLSGGVARNARLRAAMEATARSAGVPLLAAQPQHTGDNAGMIAFAAWCDADGCDRRGTAGLTIQPDLDLA